MKKITDNSGAIWTIHFSNSVILSALEEENVTIGEIAGGVEKLRIGVIASLLWAAVKRQAAERSISRDQFFDAVNIQVAIEATMDAFAESLPQRDDMPAGASGASIPLGHGQ